MPYVVPLDDARAKFPEYTFLHPLTLSEQKCAFHVMDGEGRHLCLKLISPAFEAERLNREIAALQLIVHPNVVRLHEYVYRSKGGEQLHYILEEYVDGTDLSAYWAVGRPWPLQKVSVFFMALLAGLSACHKAGVVHRDLKPANIRVRPDNSPVIVDFGVARHLGMPDITKTLLGAKVGTPLYFAPEQWDGSRRDVDHRTDLFAVGILMYEAALGVHPFMSPAFTTLGELRDAVCQSDGHLKSAAFLALPAPWQTIFKGLLARERARRLASADLATKLLQKHGS